MLCAELIAKQHATRDAMWGDKHTTKADRKQILQDAEEDVEEEEQGTCSGNNTSHQSHSADEGEDGWFISLSLYIYMSFTKY
jgi:hypothetical protein